MQEKKTEVDSELSARRVQIVNQVYSVIKNIESPEDRIKNGLNYIVSHEPKIFFDARRFILLKNSFLSSKLLDEAVALIRSSPRNNFENSFEIHTRSIGYAHPGSLELTLAYSARSELLFKTHFMHDCLKNIKYSLKIGCPSHIRANLYLRKANCHRALNPLHQPPIQEALEECKKLLSTLDQEHQQDLKGKLEIAEKSSRDRNRIPCLKIDYKDFAPTLKEKSSLVPGFSDAIAINSSEKYGRHVVATRDIKAGEILVIQKPYASIINLNERYFFCWHCSKQTYSSVPCRVCSLVIYCSKKCRDKSHKEYHHIECDILQYLFAFEITFSLLPLRLIIQALKKADYSLQNLKNNFQNMNISKDEEIIETSDDNKMKSDRLANVHRLTSQRSSGDILEAGIFFESLVIAYYLSQRSELFGKEFSQDLSDLEKDKEFIFLVEFVEKYHWIVSNNSFNITIPRYSRPLVLAHAVIPEFSFFNHSCVPMITHSYHSDNTAIIRALRPIKKGEQIFGCYVPNYTVMPLAERRTALKKYNFNCDCKACTVENWANLRETGSRATSRNFSCVFVIQEELRKYDEQLSKIKDQVKTKKKKLELSKMYNALVDTVELACEYFDENSFEVVKAKKLLNDVIFFSQIQFVALK